MIFDLEVSFINKRMLHPVKRYGIKKWRTFDPVKLSTTTAVGGRRKILRNGLRFYENDAIVQIT